jgi:DNA-binding XRE family transcriptional regulator
VTGTLVGVKLQSDQIKAIDAWATKQSPPVTRPEAIRGMTRMRERRLTLNMSQDQVGKELGVSFQQVQKYEKGVNRVSASRLFEICRILNVSLASMFERDPKV